MISTIAVGTDGTASPNEAVKLAAGIARQFGATLFLLSVFDDSPGGSAGEDIELQWASNPAARVRSILGRLEEDLNLEGIQTETRAAPGDPGKALVQLAEECDADLLVIGNKGMQRRVLGSVPNTVTHRANCSVLVVKTT